MPEKLSLRAVPREPLNSPESLTGKTHLDGLAADLAVLDVTGRAGRYIDEGLEGLAAVGHDTDTNCVSGFADAGFLGLVRLEHRLESVQGVDIGGGGRGGATLMRAH